MTGISTHVLDLTSGRPVAGVRIELFDLSTKSPTLLNRTQTNVDGRTDAPILAPENARTGNFELRFAIGDHFKGSSFLPELIPVRFVIFNASQHYHIPLVCSPWSYSTYRGS
ncbi:hydroxyisourate hydrolase [Brucella cytisi]|uniref:5-hydroxyisourate hydrolase n=1 Tax=Brucella cytisi TaxID=407152 RepID=A0A1J6HKC7_9HYPH|nr:hydroxyisourate hydrolase [Brucella cytisi]OIS92843.1 hydroxyisourate hydrolase [Brucella cytisi]